MDGPACLWESRGGVGNSGARVWVKFIRSHWKALFDPFEPTEKGSATMLHSAAMTETEASRAVPPPPSVRDAGPTGRRRPRFSAAAGPGRVESLAASCMACLALLLGLALSGCRPPSERLQIDKTEIQAVLEGYLPKLGEAYRTQNPELLEGFVVPKEKARIRLRIDELEARGQVYDPVFKTVTVEDVSVWNHSNAFVSTVEVWDVSSHTLGSGLLVNQVLDQRSRVKYQMKRKPEGWVVLYRELEANPGS